MSDFPVSLSNVADNSTDVMAKYINNIEALLGIGGSAVTTSHSYKLSGVTGSDKAASLTGAEALTNKTYYIGEAVALTAKSTELNLLAGKTVLSKSVISGGTNGVNLTPGSTQYVGIAAIVGDAYAIVIPFACVIRNLYVYTSGAPGTGKSCACTLMYSGSDSALTCTISGNASNSASDLVNAFNAAAGTRISLKTVTTADAALMSLIWVVELDIM